MSHFDHCGYVSPLLAGCKAYIPSLIFGGSGVFPAAEPVNSIEREQVAYYPGDEHNDFLAVIYADNGEQVRDAEEGEGDADKQGPHLFHFGVGGDAQAQDYDAEDEVDENTGVYIHFLAPLGGVNSYNFFYQAY